MLAHEALVSVAAAAAQLQLSRAFLADSHALRSAPSEPPQGTFSRSTRAFAAQPASGVVTE
jgi:hypothetical protein